jgi:integrase
VKVDNPAEGIQPSAIATFKPRDRALTPAETYVFFSALEQTSTMPTLRLAIKFMLLTLVRKSEFILAIWDEIDFDAAVWTVPKERMKAARPIMSIRVSKLWTFWSHSRRASAQVRICIPAAMRWPLR